MKRRKEKKRKEKKRKEKKEKKRKEGEGKARNDMDHFKQVIIIYQTIICCTCIINDLNRNIYKLEYYHIVLVL